MSSDLLELIMDLFRKNLKRKQKTAFTLAEVLITIAIIGTVSMMVLPGLQTNIRHKVLEAQAKVAARNIMEGIAIMTNLDRMGGYSSTGPFLQELKKHINIVKICQQETGNIKSDCWPHDYINPNYFMASHKDPLGRDANYFDAAAFITANGAHVLITYNKKCIKDGLEPRTCFIAAFDVNGEKLPNEWGEDKFFLNATKFRGDEFPESFDMSTEGRSLTRIEAGEQSGNEGNGGGAPNNSGNTPGNGEVWNTENSWGETSASAATPEPIDEIYVSEEEETSGSAATPPAIVP